jgi:hypothetical protein
MTDAARADYLRGGCLLRPDQATCEALERALAAHDRRDAAAGDRRGAFRARGAGAAVGAAPSVGRDPGRDRREAEGSDGSARETRVAEPARRPEREEPRGETARDELAEAARTSMRARRAEREGSAAGKSGGAIQAPASAPARAPAAASVQPRQMRTRRPSAIVSPAYSAQSGWCA